ncbi:MAG: c-type cytochrome biogenesis protein CcmI [Alphaproteobacteria bacterium]|nr:c-type cytochrome biogenesis protein CcmI [Alphaproteobacteria bacterium]
MDARPEIERRLLAAAQERDDATAGETTGDARRATAALMVAILVLVPLGSVGMYLYVGNPDLPDAPLAARQDQMRQTAQDPGQAGNLEDMLTRMEQRLESNPDDARGWALLGQGYESMRRYDDALRAFTKVAELADRPPEILIAMAEVMVLAEQNRVIPGALALMDEARAKDPTDPRPYFYRAVERLQNEDKAGALPYFVDLLNHSPADADWVADIKENLISVAAELGQPTPEYTLLPPEGGAAVAGAAPSDAPAPTAEQVQDAMQMSDGDRAAMIQSMVERLAAKLAENPDDLEGWRRLANAYRVLGQADKAAEAEAQIKRLGGQ